MRAHCQRRSIRCAQTAAPRLARTRCRRAAFVAAQPPFAAASALHAPTGPDAHGVKPAPFHQQHAHARLSIKSEGCVVQNRAAHNRRAAVSKLTLMICLFPWAFDPEADTAAVVWCSRLLRAGEGEQRGGRVGGFILMGFLVVGAFPLPVTELKVRASAFFFFSLALALRPIRERTFDSRGTITTT